MKIPKRLQGALLTAAMHAAAKRLGFDVPEEDEDDAPMGLGKKISVLVVLSGGVFWLGRMIANLRSTVGTHWNVLVDLGERHEKLSKRVDDIAAKLQDGSADERELRSLRAEVDALRARLDTLTTGGSRS